MLSGERIQGWNLKPGPGARFRKRHHHKYRVGSVRRLRRVGFYPNQMGWGDRWTILESGKTDFWENDQEIYLFVIFLIFLHFKRTFFSILTYFLIFNKKFVQSLSLIILLFLNLFLIWILKSFITYLSKMYIYIYYMYVNCMNLLFFSHNPLNSNPLGHLVFRLKLPNSMIFNVSNWIVYIKRKIGLVFSGMYMGELVRLVLEDMIEEGLIFTNQDTSVLSQKGAFPTRYTYIGPLKSCTVSLYHCTE